MYQSLVILKKINKLWRSIWASVRSEQTSEHHLKKKKNPERIRPNCDSAYRRPSAKGYQNSEGTKEICISDGRSCSQDNPSPDNPHRWALCKSGEKKKKNYWKKKIYMKSLKVCSNLEFEQTWKNIPLSDEDTIKLFGYLMLNLSVKPAPLITWKTPSCSPHHVWN